MKSLLPGDVIVFHGIVGGARGPCLVIAVEADQRFHETGDMIVLVLTSEQRLYKFITDWCEEDFKWSHWL